MVTTIIIDLIRLLNGFIIISPCFRAKLFSFDFRSSSLGIEENKMVQHQIMLYYIRNSGKLSFKVIPVSV